MKAQEAMALAAEESAKSKAAKDAIKSLMGQVSFSAYICTPSLGAFFFCHENCLELLFMLTR